MPKYSASYANTNILFEIRNVEKYRKENVLNDKSILYVVKNILLRSHVVNPSDFLNNYFIEKYGKCIKDFDYVGGKNYIEALSNSTSIWNNTIKGGDTSNPALDLFNNIESVLKKHSKNFLVNTILPEASIQDIALDPEDHFKDSRVDFFIDWYRVKDKDGIVQGDKLCIEVDGDQHATDEAQKNRDKERNEWLSSIYGRTETLRIQPSKVEKAAREIAIKFINRYHELFFENKRFRFAENTSDIEYVIRTQYDIIIRIQLLVLELLINNVTNVSDSMIELNIINTDNNKYLKELFEIAIDDLYEYIINVSVLSEAGIDEKPDVLINFLDSGRAYGGDKIVVDFRYENKYDETINSEIITIATDYYNYYNYKVNSIKIGGNFYWQIAEVDTEPQDFWYFFKNEFEVATGKRIQYKDVYNDIDGRKIKALRFFLKTIFGYDDFRSGQIGIINNLLQNNRTIGILPTGSGKSVCYILCAMLQPGVSFVVCPLVSLITDQLFNIKEFGINNVDAITSINDITQKAKILENFANGKNHILWCSPERFQIQEFRDSLIELNDVFNFGYGVIDEVHCMSEWGHDFRTSYLHLVREINNCCSDIVICGLTATAMPSTVKDLMAEFEVDNTAIRTLNRMDRDELHFEIIKSPKNEKFEVLDAILQQMDNKYHIFSQNDNGTYDNAGIVFTLTRGKYTEYPGCEAVKNVINLKYEKKCDFYHAKVKNKDDIQKTFLNNKIPLLVATKAFGMGVNKKNVRFTVHFNTPESLEAFYQEAGRAGRDHKNADCFVIDSNTYSHGAIENITKYFNMVEEDLDNISNTTNNSILNGTDMSTIAWLKKNNYESIENNVTNSIALLFSVILPQLSDSSRNALISKEPIKFIRSKEKKDDKDNGNEDDGYRESLLYKLSLIGIIDDWTIDYSKNKLINVDCITLRDKCITDGKIVNLQALLEILDVNIQKHYARYGAKHEIITQITEETTAEELIGKYLQDIYKWTAENITRARVKASRDIFEEFNDFKSSEELFEHLNMRFRLDIDIDSDLSALIQKEGKEAYEEVFNIIRDNIDSLRELYAQSQRYRTSYNIEAINFMYVILHAIFYKVDEELFNIVFNRISNPSVRNIIVMQTIELYSNDELYKDIENKEKIKTNLGAYFTKKYPEFNRMIYDKLQDDGSACNIIGENITKCMSILNNLID